MRYDESYRFPFAAYPALRLMLLIITGILLMYFLSPEMPVLIFFLCTTVFFWLISETVIRKKWPLKGGYLATISYFLIIINGAMFLVFLTESDKKVAVKTSEILHLFEWENIEVKGVIKNTGRSGAGRNVYEAEITQTEFEESIKWDYSYKVRLYGDYSDDAILSSGNSIHAEIRLYAFPERRNPHEFDYGNWLINRGFSAHGEIVQLLDVTENRSFGWGYFRSAVQKNTDTIFDGEYSHLAKALLLGYKEDLTPETRQNFSRSGLSHIMAVSGLHVGFIVAPMWYFIPFLWGSKKGKWLGIILLTILLFGYAGLTGFSPSVSRASLMAWLLTYGKLFHKIRNSINLTAVAAIIILLINPAQLFDIGFQLSFSAVFIILLLMPEAQRMIPYKHRFGFKGALISVILISIIVQAGLFPIVTYYFGEFSIVGPIANTLVIPLLSFTVPTGLMFVLMSPISPSVFQWGAVPVQYSLEWIHSVANFFGEQSFSYITINDATVSLFFVWMFGILFLATIRLPQFRWKLLIALIFAMSLLMVELTIKKPKHQTMKITFLDVGQADAIHVETPGGKHILIDAGRWSPMGNSGQRVLLPYFEYKQIEKLDAVILSHPHADHIGGMPDLIDNLNIEAIYQSDYDYDSELYQNYMEMAEQKSIPVYYSVSGDQIELDPAIRIFVVGPEPNMARDRNPNNHSVAFKLVYGDISLLFSGDAEVAQERQIAERYGDFLKSDLYKVGHHASNTSSTDIFMRYVEPKYSIASLAFRNVFGHPGSDAVLRLNEYSTHQKYTSISGAVKFVTDGKSLQKINWKE